ncbi:hypothetical protein DEFDS_P018 (plasmid) [Deferribacter desulfuricans SSM1]|uniref:Uncharacterized protein n=1 Tax=Deferribacter desulfuricans (strain DSM 14783 / JCM 11476 / NBRC 101012 / SSM1) TaxID=639282 RepID=D3PEK4_DEFDS|nr:hypothetical protein [Deferribacter desulfuricans]BAI81646.1 hypothetical protein DEFDS_P018 [Deferribacter desulfuricans SSM1]
MNVYLEIQGNFYRLMGNVIDLVDPNIINENDYVIFTGNSNKIENINFKNYDDVKQLQELGSLPALFVPDVISTKELGTITSLTSIEQDDFELVNKYQFKNIYSYESIVWNYFYNNTTYKSSQETVIFLDYINNYLCFTLLDTNNLFKFNAIPVTKEELSSSIKELFETFIASTIGITLLKNNNIKVYINTYYSNSDLVYQIKSELNSIINESNVKLINFDLVQVIKTDINIGKFYTYVEYNKLLTNLTSKKYKKYLFGAILLLIMSVILNFYIKTYNKNINDQVIYYQNQINNYNNKLNTLIATNSHYILLNELKSQNNKIFKLIESMLIFNIKNYKLHSFKYDRKTNLLHLYYTQIQDIINPLLMEDFGKIIQKYLKSIFKQPITLRINTVFADKNKQLIEVTIPVSMLLIDSEKS